MLTQRVHAALPALPPNVAHRAVAETHGFPRPTIVAALLAGLVATAWLLHRAELGVALWSRSNLPFALAAVCVVAVRSHVVPRGWRHAAALRDGAGYYAVFTLIALTGAVASYPLAALTHGYADQTLQRIDVALGFDWLAWYRLVADHRALQILGIACYGSIYLTPAILLGWFAHTGQRREAHRFLAGFWLAAVLTLALFTLMPAIGPLSYLWRGAVPYMPVSETWQSNLIPALRAHTIHAVDLGALRGLVSAPSFHAAAGTLYLRTIWRTPPLRRWLTGLVAAMLLATPVEGTHYLIDMIIGAAVAMLAMEIVDLLLARRLAAVA
ncbi:MAG: PAP2 family protein [Sphingomonas sp.]|jgi:hypothetical protein|nr:MAG: PAP2 family protein [Sphingomonas sp.]